MLLFVALQPALGQVLSDGYGSLLLFPRVVANETEDTLIFVNPVNGSPIWARCFYISAPPSSTVREFHIRLERNRPTHWVALFGRPNVADPPCAAANPSCNGAGTDPGPVPGVPVGFTGELLCVEVDELGLPLAGNHLAGSASLRHLPSGDQIRYSALPLQANVDVPFEGTFETQTLCLGAGGDCEPAGQYGGCPTTWFLNHRADVPPVPEGEAQGEEIRTEITVAPCSRDLTGGAAMTETTVQISIVTELGSGFEMTLPFAISGSTTFTLNDVFGLTQDFFGSEHLTTRISSQSGGISLVAQEIHQRPGQPAQRASTTLQAHHGTQTAADQVVVPPVEE